MDGQTDGQTDRQMDGQLRQMDRQTDRQTDRDRQLAKSARNDEGRQNEIESRPSGDQSFQ